MSSIGWSPASSRPAFTATISKIKALSSCQERQRGASRNNKLGMMWWPLSHFSWWKQAIASMCPSPNTTRLDCNNNTRKDWCYVIIFKGWHGDVPIMEALNQRCLYTSLKVHRYSPSHAFKTDPFCHLGKSKFLIGKICLSWVWLSLQKGKFKAAARLLSPEQL